jgi:hypothetical protein
MLKDRNFGFEKWHVRILDKSNIKSDKSHYLYNCVCKRCGIRFLARFYDINKGRVKSCGCVRKKEKKRSNFRDWSNETVNFLNVIKQVGVNKDGLILWECACTFKGCGNVVIVSSAMLRKNKESCGCKQKYDTIKRSLSEYRLLRDKR